MADPLRRTLLAKLRGKKSRKGATVSGGLGSAAAAANGGREGKEKVLQRDSDEVRPVVLDCTTERMSTYENWVDGALVRAGGVVVFRERPAAEGPQERSGGGRVRVNEQLPGGSLQREVQFGGHVLREADWGRPGPVSDGRVPVPHVQRRRFVSVPQRCGGGDSIGFGDSSNQIFSCARVGPRTVRCEPQEGRAAPADSGPRLRGHLPHMAGTVVAANVHNDNWTSDSGRTADANAPGCATFANPLHAAEKILIRNMESYEPEFAGESAGGLQSPTFFPTTLEICDMNMASLRAPEGSLRYRDSEDEDYYDNEILPFYETFRAQSERAEVVELPGTGQDGGARETDRLRSQLKEAYYLLINAMNDINLDVQQISGALTEQQATSSCSSHSRDSLCSRLSAKNMDSDSWSSGGDHSPQQVSDTDSLLLCLSGNPESGLTARPDSRSMENLSSSQMKPTLLRSASDGAIRYPGGPWRCIKAPGTQVCGDKRAAELEAATEGVGAAGVGGLSDSQVLLNATSSEELLQNAGGEEGAQLNESSGSINSLTGSSDSNTEASAHQGPDNKQQLIGVRAQGGHQVNKGHGVTVNKMQEWMHKGRLLSSEMKQRIEGSALPRAGSQNQDQPAAQANLGGCRARVHTSSRGGKPVKAKSPLQQQPGRKATRSGLNSRGSSKSGNSPLPPPYDLCHPPPLIVNSVWWPSTLHFLLFWMQSKGTRHLRPFLLSFTTL